MINKNKTETESSWKRFDASGIWMTGNRADCVDGGSKRKIETIGTVSLHWTLSLVKVNQTGGNSQTAMLYHNPK